MWTRNKMAKNKKIPKITLETHSLIPNHSVCSDKEKQQVLEQYNLTTNEMPKILASDAGIKNLKAKPGDMIKIERDDWNLGKNVFYRVIIDG
jgi:DNA-directed RNA polymerase subunit H (RpoH/RPB5)